MKKIAALRKKGVGIVAAVLIMLIVGVMGATMASLSGDNSMSSVNYFKSQQAFFLAESGVQRALYEVSKGGGAWAGWSGTDPKTIQQTLTGYGDYDISIAAPASKTPVITAKGYVPGRSAAGRAVRVVTFTAKGINLFGQYAGFANGSSGGNGIVVTMVGSSLTDSYDSSIGPYNVSGNKGSDGNIGTNADISTAGSAHIYGNVTTGPAGTFNDQSDVSGTITHDSNVVLPAVVVPPLLLNCTAGCTNGGSISLTGSGAQTIPSGNYQYSKISATGSAVVTIVGPANIYITGSTSLKTTGSAQIAVSAASTGPVIIYFAGNVDTAGSGIVNNSTIPSNFQLYGSSTSSQDVKLTGSAAFYGVVYAPHGDVSLAGSSGSYGSFIGDELSLVGSSAIHHDVNLANMTLPSFMSNTWQVSGWKEVY
ncbi:MAG: hypothetical protein WCI27_08095 [Candidatus Omnitrophota bacterium]